MKRNLFAWVLAAFALLAGMGPAAAQFLRLDIAYVGRDDEPSAWTAWRIKELAEAAMPGKITARVLDPAEAVEPGKLSGAVVLGDIQLALIPVPFMSAYSSRFQIFEFPFVFNSLEDIAAWQDGPKGRALLQGLGAKGLVGLGYLRAGPRHTAAARALLRPADAEGLRFLLRDFPIARALLNATKGKALLAGSGESIADLIASGAVEVVRGTWADLESSGAAEGLGVVTRSNDVFETHVAVTGTALWNDMSRPMREAVEAAVRQAIADGDAYAVQRNADARRRLADKGVQVVDLAADDIAAWRVLYRDVLKAHGVQLDEPAAK
ncbi:MAG: TRAP transporter substrate-binding protein [Actinomycetota bacterium]